MTCDCKGSPPVEWLRAAERLGRYGLALELMDAALRHIRDPEDVVARVAHVLQEAVGEGFSVPSLRTEPQEPAS